MHANPLSMPDYTTLRPDLLGACQIIQQILYYNARKGREVEVDILVSGNHKFWELKAWDSTHLASTVARYPSTTGQVAPKTECLTACHMHMVVLQI